MREFDYRKGLQEIKNGVYAYLQPDGAWGLSNSGLIMNGDQSMLVDTLFDLNLTKEMLGSMRAEINDGLKIQNLVITHANGDHCFGTELFEDADIITTKTCAEQMAESPPQVLAGMLKGAHEMGELGEFLHHIFGKFTFEGINPRRPTRTFEDKLKLEIGDKEIHLIEVGPAHTRSDLLVFSPEDRIIFSGDILFIGVTPIMWAGPSTNWIKACDLMLDMDADVFVPGHGPITDKGGVEMVRNYLEYVRDETLKRYEAGMNADEAAEDIDLGVYSRWCDSERIVVNVSTFYRELREDGSQAKVPDLLGKMAKLWKKRNAA